MNAWMLALGNVQRATVRTKATQRVYQAGLCQWCGNVPPEGRHKFCNNDCMRRFHNFERPTTRAGRKP